jgi:hypothetical protein
MTMKVDLCDLKKWQKILTRDSFRISGFQGMLNSVMNPIIYAFWYAQFRLRISKAWRQCFRRCV